jgi:Niemann-Pick C1 protein
MIGSSGTPISSFDAVLPIEHEDLALGLRLERFFEDSFRRWGIFVACHPYPIMIASLLVSVFLAMGMGFWKVTTDPVDLWVSSGSQARHDMEFFNRNFWKFYRIEQIVVSPANTTNPRPFEYSYKTSQGITKKQTFGPAFDQSFMLKIFRLQKELESLTVKGSNGKSIKLDNICFKPLEKECATQSIFTYFLDDESLITSPDYTERIEVCTR